jgi:16S rRNA C1402 N4-methylase RsmH
VFHSHCLQEWKDQGKNSCPICRKIIDGAQFKITVTVQNNYTATANSVSLNEDSISNVFDLFDINFDVDEVPDLDSILADLGVSLSDFDTSILDAE